MDLEKRLSSIGDNLAPTSEQHTRIRARMLRRLNGPAVLRDAQSEATPVQEQQDRIHTLVLRQTAHPRLASLFDRLRAALSPSSSAQARVKQSVFARLLPPAPVPLMQHVYKWGAAFVVVALVVRASPLLFLAPQSNAESSVILDPSPAGVELSSQGLWQPVTKEIELHEMTDLRTQNGEATIIMHDDGNIRLAANTTLRLDDVTDQTAATTAPHSITLTQGTVWLQALLPDQLSGFAIATPEGTVTVHGGSVSVSVLDGKVHVEVWDRIASATHAGKTLSLVAGEQTDLISKADMVVTPVAADAYKQPWIAQNLQRDSVHRREMAQLQQERRAAEAGILPTSPFYPVKRVAETMDVLLTLDPQARTQKRLDQANTRLNEAAALLIQGNSGASVPLNEYKQTIIDVASGSGANSTLVQQTIAENAAQLSAALPDDQIYVLKKTVLEASAQIPNDTMNQQDVSGALLVDSLDVLQQAIQDHDADQVQQSLQSLSSYLPSLQTGSGDTLKPDVRKEVQSLLSDVVTSLHATDSGSTIVSTVTQQLGQYLPKTETETSDATSTKPTVATSAVAALTEAQLEAAVQGSIHRVFDIYTMPHSRLNALRVEMKKFQGSPDEGRYLRLLYREMPDNDTFRQLVRTAIQNLRSQQFVDQSASGTGSIAQ